MAPCSICGLPTKECPEPSFGAFIPLDTQRDGFWKTLLPRRNFDAAKSHFPILNKPGYSFEIYPGVFLVNAKLKSQKIHGGE